MRSSATIGYKLACEYMEASYAYLWDIISPAVALVSINPLENRTCFGKYIVSCIRLFEIRKCNRYYAYNL